ncbi:DUF736 domain-containing protein [Bartonella sp. LJL80]
MQKIGTFTKIDNHFDGYIRSLLIDCGCSFEATEQMNDHAAAYRLVLTESPDITIGYAWHRKGKNAGDYLSVQVSSPVLSHSIKAFLFQDQSDNNTWSLLWNKPGRKTQMEESE